MSVQFLRWVAAGLRWVENKTRWVVPVGSLPVESLYKSPNIDDFIILELHLDSVFAVPLDYILSTIQFLTPQT